MSSLNKLFKGPVIIVARNMGIKVELKCARGPIIVARQNCTLANSSSRGPIIVAKENSPTYFRGPIIVARTPVTPSKGPIIVARQNFTLTNSSPRGPIIVAKESSTASSRGPVIIVARNHSTLSANTDSSRGPIIVARAWNGSTIIGRHNLNHRGPVIIVARHNSTKADIHSIIRVDHAGELGADRIYAGQMAVLGQTSKGPLIQHMWDQEKGHRAKFEELIRKHRVRPTVMAPIWDVMAFGIGAGSALLGEKAAMACTVAVETVIVDHYNDQLRELTENPAENKELMDAIKQFRDEEQEHHDTGIDHGAEQAPFYKALTETIKFGCKAAIAISKVV